MAYKVCLSNKSELRIDRDELPSVQEGIQSGARLIKVRSGMFNPAFIVTIEPDYRRIDDPLEKLPDMFERISRLASVEDVLQNRIEAPKEPEKDLNEMKRLTSEFKPDFLKR